MQAEADEESTGAEAVEQHAGLESVMARSAGENFPVALRLLPSAVRDHLRGGLRIRPPRRQPRRRVPPATVTPPSTGWRTNSTASSPGPRATRPSCNLAPTVQRFGLAREPFDQLLAANRLDQHKSRYQDFDELLGYCELSANPVGHLVLAVFEASTPERVAASDDVCSGLQVLEHLQDVAEDAAAGRVYLPADDMEHFGVTADDLRAPVAGATSGAWSPTRPAGPGPCSPGADHWWRRCADRPAWPWPGSWPAGSPTSTRSGPPDSTCWAGPPGPARTGCWAAWPAFVPAEPGPGAGRARA